jgi:hypothetical protein
MSFVFSHPFRTKRGTGGASSIYWEPGLGLEVSGGPKSKRVRFSNRTLSRERDYWSE